MIAARCVTIPFICVWAVLASGCAESAEREQKGGQSAPSPKNADPRETVFVVPLESAAVITAVPAQPKFYFEIGGKLGGAQQYASFLAARFTLGGVDGKHVPVAIAEAVDKDQAGYHPKFSVSPVVPLATDQWYWLTIDQDEKLKVQGGSVPWRLAFFTGSAPRIVHVEWSQKSPILRVEFSEAVEVKGLSIDSLLTIAGKSVATCVLVGETCISASDKEKYISRVLNVQLDVGVPCGSTATVTIPGDVMGSGRTVAQGAAASGEMLASSGGLSTTVQSHQWASCNGGASKCWTLVKYPDSASP